MKKLIAIALVMVLAIPLLTACGGGNTSSSGNNTENPPTSSVGGNNTAPTNSAAPPDKPARVVEIPDKPLDVSDKSLYFAIIDGVKYNLIEATVQDFLDAGFSLGKDEDQNRLIKPDPDKIQRVQVYKEGLPDVYFEIGPYSDTENGIPLKDCLIDEIVIRNKNADIAIVCNLALGCAEDDLIKCFGEKRMGMYNYVAVDFGRFYFEARDGVISGINIAYSARNYQ